MFTPLLLLASYSQISLKFLNLILVSVLGVPLELEGVSDPCGVLGEALPWFIKVFLFPVCGVLCCASVGRGGTTVEELFAAVHSSYSSWDTHVFTFIVFSKLPSQTSSSIKFTSLLIINFLVDGLESLKALESSLYPKNIHLFRCCPNYFLVDLGHVHMPHIQILSCEWQTTLFHYMLLLEICS